MNINAFARFRQLARLIIGPPKNVETCNQYRKYLPDYVDAEMDGQTAAQLYPQVRRHLEACLDCQAYYADQLVIAQREAFNELPRFARAPRFDLSFLPSHGQTFGQMVYESAKRIIQTAHPDYLVELDLIRDRLLEILNSLKDQSSLRESTPVSALALGFADQAPAARWVLATLMSLQKMHATTARGEIERLKSTGELDRFLSSIAQEAARQAGLRRGDIRKFVSAFAKLYYEELWEELASLLF